MRPLKSTRMTSRRVPLTITLDQANYDLIESCVSLKEFESIDAFFDAALKYYRRHLHALHAYTEDQSHKGLSRAEILESIQCETVLTKVLAPRQVRRR